MKRDFSLRSLAAALESGYGIAEVSVSPLPGKAHSLNFRAVAKDSSGGGTVFAAKLIPRGRTVQLSRLKAHASSIGCSNACTMMFGGKTLDFGKWKILALRWIEGGRVHTDAMDAAHVDSLVSAYKEFSAGLRNDGFILPAREAASLKKSLLEKTKSAGLESWTAELKLMEDSSLTLDPASVRIIHGDLHYENFRFAGDRATGFLDIEEFRYGTPAEDFVRFVMCCAERRKWLSASAKKRVLATFAGIVRSTRLSRREWLFAINSYLLRKLDKRLKRGRPSIFTRINIAFRFGFYRELREIVYANTDPGRTGGRTVVKMLGGTVRRFMGRPQVEWGDKLLFTCDPACEDYDWLCVYDELPAKYPGVRRGRLAVRCPLSRTILATQEPVAVKSYNRAYLSQFGFLLTNRPPEADGHPRRVKGEGYMVWYTGRPFGEEAARPFPEKTKTVSAVCSSKKMRHTNHAARYRLLKELEKSVPGLDWFGKGVRPLETKADALDPYKYHIAVENHIAPGHWTEKLADPLVCGCLPFYAGDPHVSKVLPEGCFIPIPADDPARAAAIVNAAIAAGEWEKRRGAIEKARSLLFGKYNLFAQIAALIDAAPAEAPAGAAGTLLTRRRARLSDPVSAISDLVAHFSRAGRTSKNGGGH